MKLHSSPVHLPAHYQSLHSADEKVQFADRVATQVAARGLSPVSASVVGSQLRGVDTASSDMDVLVLVSEKLPRALTLHLPGGDDAQVQSVSAFCEKVSTSVPYFEFLRSPFRLDSSEYGPLLNALRPNMVQLQAHAQRFAQHLVSRTSAPVEKRARNAACCHYLMTTGSVLCPRSLVEPGRHPVAAQWIEDTCRDSSGVLTSSVEQVVRVLRGQ